MGSIQRCTTTGKIMRCTETGKIRRCGPVPPLPVPLPTTVCACGATNSCTVYGAPYFGALMATQGWGFNMFNNMAGALDPGAYNGASGSYGTWGVGGTGVVACAGLSPDYIRNMTLDTGLSKIERVGDAGCTNMFFRLRIYVVAVSGPSLLLWEGFQSIANNTVRIGTYYKTGGGGGGPDALNLFCFVKCVGGGSVVGTKTVSFGSGGPFTPDLAIDGPFTMIAVGDHYENVMTTHHPAGTVVLRCESQTGTNMVLAVPSVAGFGVWTRIVPGGFTAESGPYDPHDTHSATVSCTVS